MEAKTMTLVEELQQHCGCYSDRDEHHHCISCRAAEALEEAQKALEPFAKHARLLEEARQDGFVAHAGPMDADDLRLARSVHSKLKGVDPTQGERGDP